MVGVSRSGYYKWLRRKNTPAPRVREVSDAELVEAITKIWRRSRGSYGSRRVTRQLRRDGITANRVDAHVIPQGVVQLIPWSLGRLRGLF